VYPPGDLQRTWEPETIIRKDTHTMRKDNVIQIKNPERFIDDPITEILRSGARKLLAEALETEIEIFLSDYKDLKDNLGRKRLIRNGYLPEREIQTGIGAVPVKVPRIRDRHPYGAGSIKFTSALLPPYLRKSKSLEELIPWLYLKGVSTGDFSEALTALVGKDAQGLSSSTVSRLKVVWEEEYKSWKDQDLSNKRYVYIWADGIYCNVRMEDRECLLVIIGATKEGKKELIALESGMRESELSWTEILLDLKRRGLKKAPELAVGDGALGFWKAIAKVYDKTRWQRCWVHKAANVLNKLPKSLQKKANAHLREIWMAPTKDEAEKQFDDFVSTYGLKYPKAAECLQKDRETLLTFYDFPAEHWKHIRTTNPIESTFSTVRLRTVKVRSCFSSTTVVTMGFKLCQSAQNRWQHLQFKEKLGQIIEGIKFINGVEEVRNAA